MINGPKNVFVEKEGRIQSRKWSFATTTTCSRSSTGSSPASAAASTKRRRWSTPGCRTARGSTRSSRRWHSTAPVVTIRMFGSRPLSKEDLLRFKAFTPEMLALMEGAMKARLNIIISGGTGSGKTTLLNTLSSFIQPDHRVITIEDAAELQLQQDHIVRLETGPPTSKAGARHRHRPGQERPSNAARPDHHRRVPRCGDARHDPGHEHRPRRLDDDRPRQHPARRPLPARNHDRMAGLELPIRALRAQFAAAVDLIIQASRLQGGREK